MGVGSFCEYMYYLLTSPFKKVRESCNQWHILFKVLGMRFDEAMESLYRAGEQTMVATCDPEMVMLHAEDRGMKRHDGESTENFRCRIAMYREVCMLGGTDPGILLAVRTLGYGGADIKTARELKGDGERWAEFYILIRLGMGQEFPIPFQALRREVRNWKEVGAKDNYQFTIESAAPTNKACGTYRAAIGLHCRQEEKSGICAEIRLEGRNRMASGLTVDIKHDLWHLDGAHRLDGKQLLDAYERTEELP